MKTDVTDQEGLDKKNIARKIQSLLALADKGRNNSDAEADLALSKAYDLLAKHHLTLDEIHDKNLIEAEDDTITETKFDSQYSSVSSKIKFILWLLEKHFYVHCILHTQYHPMDGKRQKFISFIGTGSDVEIAKYIFNYLSDEFERRWGQYRTTTGATVREKKGFMYGIYKGIDANLRKKRQQTARDVGINEKQLMKTDGQIEAYVQLHYPKLGKSSMDWEFDHSSYHHGVTAGQAVTIHSAVKDNAHKQAPLHITQHPKAG